MRLNQVTVGTIDVARAVPFYQGLGLCLIVRSTDRYARFVCPDGDSTFSVELVTGAVGSSTLVYFECDDLDARVLALRSAGYEIEGPTDQTWGWREAHLRDPDGNRVCLFFGGEHRKNPPWRLAESI